MTMIHGEQPLQRIEQIWTVEGSSELHGDGFNCDVLHCGRGEWDMYQFVEACEDVYMLFTLCVDIEECKPLYTIVLCKVCESYAWGGVRCTS